MRIGQTSAIVFVSTIIGSAIGFLATLYFARILGAEIIGIYASIAAVASWLSLTGQLGVCGGIKKRLSEGSEQAEYLAAGILMIVLIASIVIVFLIGTQPYLEAYISDFAEYSDISVVVFVSLFMVVKLFHSIVNSILQGYNLVHISGLLSPIKNGTNSLIKVLLVAGGFGLLGMLTGYISGMIITSTIGLVFVTVSLKTPSKEHFKRVYDYAKYSWLGGLEKRAFNDIDILVLTAFVPSTLVGVYSVSWSISKFLALFGSSIRKSMFPEISRLSVEEDPKSATHLIEDSLAFGGLIIIPGLIGGVILAERLLQIYGPEFVQGAAVLGFLILAVLIHSFQKLLTNVLNAIDRPDISFRINLIFVIVNLVFNIILVWAYGWVGAAVATALSAVIGLALAYRSLQTIVPFMLPRSEIGYQVGAALFMGGIVWVVLQSIETMEIIQHNVVTVLGLVTLGASVYFLTLYWISDRFRSTVLRNVSLP